MLQVTLPHREGDPTARQTIEKRLSPYVTFEVQPEIEDEDGTFGPPPLDPPPREEKPRVVHATFFLMDFYDDIRDDELQNPRIFQCNSSSTELKDHVGKAREIFSRMFPDAEFLPKAPQPEDVDMEDDREDLEEDGNSEEPNQAPSPANQNGFPQ